MKIKRAGQEGRLGHYFENLAARGLIGFALALPYRARVRTMGWIMSHLVGPFAGYNQRVRDNLGLVAPDMPKSDVERLARAVTDNAGRTLIEIYSGKEFIARLKDTPMEGAGIDAFFEARAAGRPVVMVTGHFGNYDVPRGALAAMGHPMGALYNPLRNPFFNAHYERAIGAISQPIFPRGRRGLAQMVNHLKGGGIIGMLIDVHMGKGVPLPFFGKPAKTALSAAEIALKYDALVVPTYGIRAPNGIDFTLRIEAPVPHTTPEEMTRVLNASLEALTRDHMEQWFWIHRRWK